MRQLASFLLVAFALPVAVAPAVAAEAWRWKDDKGAIHYSDTPVPGAERVTLPAPPNVGTVVTPAPPPRVAPPEPFKYTECVVQAPGKEQNFQNVSTVTAAVRIAPSLQPGHSLVVMLDGNPYGAWPARMLTSKLENLQRGSHSLSVVVQGADKKTLCTGPAITFHVHQPSLLSPLRAKPKP
jgi:hypothetical protein